MSVALLALVLAGSDVSLTVAAQSPCVSHASLVERLEKGGVKVTASGALDVDVSTAVGGVRLRARRLTDGQLFVRTVPQRRGCEAVEAALVMLIREWASPPPLSGVDGGASAATGTDAGLGSRTASASDARGAELGGSGSTAGGVDTRAGDSMVGASDARSGSSAPRAGASSSKVGASAPRAGGTRATVGAADTRTGSSERRAGASDSQVGASDVRAGGLGSTVSAPDTPGGSGSAGAAGVAEGPGVTAGASGSIASDGRDAASDWRVGSADARGAEPSSADTQSADGRTPAAATTATTSSESPPSRWQVRVALVGGVAALFTSPVPTGSLLLDLGSGAWGVSLDGALEGTATRSAAPGQLSLTLQWLTLGARWRFSGGPVDFDLGLGVRGSRLVAEAQGFTTNLSKTLLGVGPTATATVWIRHIGPLQLVVRLSAGLRLPAEQLVIVNGPTVELGLVQLHALGGLALAWP